MLLSFLMLAMMVNFIYPPIHANGINNTESIKINYDNKRDIIIKYNNLGLGENDLFIILADKKGNHLSVFKTYSMISTGFPISDYEVRDINNDGIKEFFGNITYEHATSASAVGSIFLTVINNKLVEVKYPDGNNRVFRTVDKNGIVRNGLGGSRASTMNFNMEVMGIRENPNYGLLTDDKVEPNIFDKLYFESRMTPDFKMEYIPKFFVNYEVKNMKYNPIYINGVPLVAIAELKEHMGFDIKWNRKTKSISLMKNGTNIELKNNDFYISNNRSYINPEKIAKKFGYRYHYDNTYKIFTIDNKFLFGY